ncbi:MAG: DUF6434 domain-containing protein [Bacteroidota bacterium]
MDTRPPFKDITTAADFDRWYWMKNELVEICKSLGLPSNDRKNELRRRVIDHFNGAKYLRVSSRPKSNFDWSKETLSLDTVITDSVTFGNNLRTFMKLHITKFSFNIEFMEWIKSNLGKTLEEAVIIYPVLLQEIKRGKKLDKSDYNVMNAYLESFLANNPKLQRDDAMKCWQIKKYLPAPKGLVKYDPSDLTLL